MRISGSTFTFMGLPLEQCMGKLKSLGFSFADLYVHWDLGKGHFHPLDVMREPLAVLEAVEQVEASTGVKFVAMNIGTEQFSASERGQVEASCKLCRRVSIPVVNILCGRREERIEMRRIRDFLSIAKDHGLTLSIETTGGCMFMAPAVAVGLLGEAPGLKVALDTGHLLSNGIPQAEWAPLIPYTAHVHLKDAGTDLRHHEVPFGTGALDFAGLLDSLRAARYDGAITVEYLGPRSQDAVRFDPEPEVVKVLGAWEKWLYSAPGNSGAGNAGPASASDDAFHRA
jgi:sugar phosphate isomerase/epimerase